jgi:hypothetical protein
MLQKLKQLLHFTSIVTLTLAFPENIKAQSSAIFMMSSIGNLAGSSTSGMAFQFNSNGTCLNIQNGVAILNSVRGNGPFAVDCEVNFKINSLGLKIYPNPVKSITKVKFINTPPLSEYFNLTIWTTDGVLILTRKESGYDLFKGLNIDMSNLISGSYVLKVGSSAYVDALKFIKAD